MMERPKDAYKLAGELTRKIGMVPTGANVQTIRLAIEAEADYSGVSLDEAAKVITVTAIKDAQRGQDVNRFYFEDARWRRSRRNSTECSLHPESGLTPWGACWACYSERCSQEATA